ncbi:MAG TPA: PAS domain S-box protein [Kofleriaceae bacterium]
MSDDARWVLRAAPDLYLLVDPALVIVDASDAYLRATSATRDAIVGRGIFDVFPGDTEGVVQVRASFGHVIAHREAHELPVLRYPFNGVERVWRSTNTPVLAEDGSLQFVLHRAEDITSAVSRPYERLFEYAPDAILIVGTDGRIRLVNAQTEALFGYARAELVGQPLELLVPNRFRGGHAAHMHAYFAQPSPRPMGSGLRLFGRRKDGVELPIEVSLSPQRGDDGAMVAASIRDISERRALEAKAALVTDRLRSAVESIEDAFALFDGDDNLVMCNSTFRGLIGDSVHGPLVGLPYAAILDGWLGAVAFTDARDRARFREDRLARHAVEATSTFEVALLDGRTLRVIDRRTAEHGMVKTIVDRTEDERRAKELGEARQAAEAASAAKSEFLSSMSHELRTPLNAILGFAQLLERDQREPLSTRHRDRVGHILRGGEHLLRLIDDILDLARIEAGRVAISLEPVDVAELLEELRRTLEPIGARQQIALAIDPAVGLPPVHADRTRLSQILMNLGSNAIKYNRPGGSVRFSVERTPAARLRVTVTDTGHGIPATEHGKLFQPFQRAGQETGPIEGTGIGLVITKRLAELMHGAVGFRSVEHEGSAFWVELPIETEAVAAPPPASPSAQRSSLGVGRHLVLYVEDNPANVRFMEDVMSSFEGVELVSVPTAELGVTSARARPPALVLMDINLPGMSGLDALRVLRGDPRTAGIPVIALTAAANPKDRERGLEHGFYRYLTKPVKVDELIEAVEAALAQSGT